MCILTRKLKRKTNGTESTLHQYVNQHWHICTIGLCCSKHIKEFGLLAQLSNFAK
jgi:hypothetical protein